MFFRFFPYLFLTIDRLNYVGNWPAKEFYCIERMKTSTREEFSAWYRKVQFQTFDMRKEIESYLESDVLILTHCLFKFDSLFHSITALRPLSVAVTIAQACNAYWRKDLMEENTIAILPHKGYEWDRRMSAECHEWLSWYSESNKVRVRHGRNAKEEKIGPYFVSFIG